MITHEYVKAKDQERAEIQSNIDKFLSEGKMIEVLTGVQVRVRDIPNYNGSKFKETERGS